MKIITSVAALILLLFPLSAKGHGGGLDRNGCHTNRKTGEYHCHGTPAPSAAPSSGSRGSGPSPAVRRISADAPTVQSSATSPERDLVRTAQVLLRSVGYQPTMLGSLDDRTRTAIRAFQRAKNIEATGVVDEYLVLRLAEAAVAKCP